MSEWCEAFWSVTHESMLANNVSSSTVHRAQHTDHNFTVWQLLLLQLGHGCVMLWCHTTLLNPAGCGP